MLNAAAAGRQDGILAAPAEGGGNLGMEKRALLLLKTGNFQIQRKEIAARQNMIRLRSCQLIHDGLSQKGDAGGGFSGNEKAEYIIRRQLCSGSRRKLVKKEPLGIEKEIRPPASGIGGGVGSVGDVAWNTGNISRPERQRSAVIKFNRPALGVADADFETVVEMQMAAGYIGYFPLIPGKNEYRKGHWKIIVSVFDNGLPAFSLHIFSLSAASAAFLFSVTFISITYPADNMVESA